MYLALVPALAAYGLFVQASQGKPLVTQVIAYSLTICLSEALIDPRTRFSDIRVTIPQTKWPVLQSSFESPPDCGEESYRGTARLAGRRALVTGGDSGIGRAVVIAYAREGANVAINYLPEEESDATALASILAKEGLHITKIPGDLLNETFCGDLVHRANKALGGLDLIVNNAGYVLRCDHRQS
jgi:hypothetical protein